MFDLRHSFDVMTTCNIFTADEKDKIHRFRQILLKIDDSIYDDQCGEFTRTYARELKGVADRGGILALIHVNKIIQGWQSMCNSITIATPDYLGDVHCEELLRSFLIFNASIAPANIDQMDIAAPTSLPLHQIPEWFTDIDPILYQRYEIQCAFIINAVNKALVKSKHELKDECMTVLERIAPNVKSGDRFIRYINKRLYQVPLALSVKAKAIFDPCRGNQISKFLLDALLSDVDLKEVKLVIL